MNIQSLQSYIPNFSPGEPLIIAGPCSAENYDQVIETAKQISEKTKTHVFRAGIWKPRTRPGQFEGIGKEGLEWLKKLNHKIEKPVPSLFTFNMPTEPITKLMGVVVENALVNIQGTKLNATGPLLITHWGMSGPAILKTSSFGARILNEKNYNIKIQINWVNQKNNDLVLELLQNIIEEQEAYKYLDSEPQTLSAKAHRPPYGKDGDYFAKPSSDDVFEQAYEVMHEVNPYKFPSLY